MPEFNLICPEFIGFRIMPVGEDGVTGPNSADIQAAIWILDPNIFGLTAGVGVISIEESNLLALFVLYG